MRYKSILLKLIFITFFSDNCHRGVSGFEVVLRMKKPTAGTRLTKHSLRELRELGFRYVLVNGYTPDWQFDYIALSRFILVPVKELPVEPGQKGIYAPIESDILDDWANQPDSGISAFIEGYVQA
jgi:hypothetical protein